jgi:DNA-binding transcriptional ArsR family regulator
MMTTRTRAQTERTARILRALADEKRLRILELLRGGEQCVCDLTDVMAETAGLPPRRCSRRSAAATRPRSPS